MFRYSALLALLSSLSFAQDISVFTGLEFISSENPTGYYATFREADIKSAVNDGKPQVAILSVYDDGRDREYPCVLRPATQVSDSLFGPNFPLVCYHLSGGTTCYESPQVFSLPLTQSPGANILNIKAMRITDGCLPLNYTVSMAYGFKVPMTGYRPTYNDGSNSGGDPWYVAAASDVSFHQTWNTNATTTSLKNFAGSFTGWVQKYKSTRSLTNCKIVISTNTSAVKNDGTFSTKPSYNYATTATTYFECNGGNIGNPSQDLSFKQPQCLISTLLPDVGGIPYGAQQATMFCPPGLISTDASLQAFEVRPTKVDANSRVTNFNIVWRSWTYTDTGSFDPIVLEPEVVIGTFSRL